MTESKKQSKTFKIPLTFDSIGKGEKEAVVSVLESGFYTMGKEVLAFEKQFARLTGTKHCVMVNSGSSANLLLIASYLHGLSRDGLLKPGDEVLIPALLWPTTLWPIVQLGLKPILVDVVSNTMSIDITDAEKKLSCKTRAIFLIHVLGIPANMNKVTTFSKKNNLILLEDCCESLGAKFNSQHVGTFGSGGTFSFFFSHHISTIEGGAVITNCEKHANDLRSMRAHGWIRDRSDKEEIEIKNTDNNVDSRWLFVLPGFNLRPTELQGAIGQVQLSKLSKYIQDRKFIADKVAIIISEIDFLEVIGHNLTEKMFDKTWMNVPIRVRQNTIATKQQIVSIFEENGFETRPIIAGNFCLHPAGALLNNSQDFPETQQLHDQAFMISAFTDNVNYYLKLLSQVKEKICQL